MIKWVTAALGLVVSMAVGAGLAAAHDKAEKPSMTGETIDERDDAELEGTLEILHEDREDGSGVYRHFLSRRDGRRLPLEGVQHPDLLTGDLVRVRGVKSGQKLQLQTNIAEALQVLQFAPLSNTLGPQKTIVLLVNFADNPSHRPWTTSAMQDYLYEEVDGFIAASSYQQTSLVVDVVGWYTLPMTSVGCNYWSIASNANQAATAAGINLSLYARRLIFFPYTTNCTWVGMGTVGGNPSTTWVNGFVSFFTHEFGHNLGLYHSHAMDCTSLPLSPPCTIHEYGDHTDAMGGGGHYNPFQKQRLGWLDYDGSPPITRVQQSGTYTIEAYDLPGTASKALKIHRGATAQAFFVSLRRLVRFESAAGVFVHLATDGIPSSSYLLDMTPDGPKLQSDGNLAVGKHFTDPVSGITIQTVSVSGTSATIVVTMGGVPPSSPSTPTALVGGPQLTWTPGTPATQTGFVVERAPGATAPFASIATTTAPNYLDASGVAGQCYRVRATNATGTSGPSNVACATTPPPPPPGDVTLTITAHSPIGREMTFRGTLTGSTTLSATVDSIAVAAKYIVVDRTRKTWTVKATGLFKGPHTFAVASGTLAVSESFTVLK